VASPLIDKKCFINIGGGSSGLDTFCATPLVVSTVFFKTVF